MVSPTDRIEKAAPVIADQISRMDRLVEMMLAMVQPELKAQEAGLENLFENSFPSVRQRAKDKSVELLYSTAVSRWSFNPFHMGRAIENLLMNAVAFAPPDGRVKVGWHKQRTQTTI